MTCGFLTVRKALDFRPQQPDAITQRGNGGQWVKDIDLFVHTGPELAGATRRGAEKLLLCGERPAGITFRA